MDLDLSGKLALVTGSTRGIGLAAAKGLAEMGADVIVSGRANAVVDEAIAKLKPIAKGKLHAAALDLGNADGCAALIKQFPEVDIFVNNLGIYGPKGFFDIEDVDWARMFEINVMSGVRLTRHYLKRMLDHKDWGRVVFVSSESGIYVPKEMVHYGFSKAAQLFIARGAAEQTKGTNSTVNSVLPGPTWVEQMPALLAARAKAAGTTVDDLKSRTFRERRPASLLQRYARPEEVANLICYVCSKASSATNGAALRVDGGIVTNPFQSMIRKSVQRFSEKIMLHQESRARGRFIQIPSRFSGYVTSSLNLLSTSFVIASIASSASGPSAETLMVVPGPAASIINPMIDVPPTVSLPRVTQTSALNFSTI
jgi:NAD(P)-dependent dehydrogenase (short-subunit alcohol dehydrogenase family)